MDGTSNDSNRPLVELARVFVCEAKSRPMANVVVIAMPSHHQLQILVTEEITSPSERRRIQNRENQKKMRKSKILKATPLVDTL